MWPAKWVANTASVIRCFNEKRYLWEQSDGQQANDYKL